MIKKFYDKNELAFSIIWIVAYCVLASMGDNLSDALGISKIITLPILLVLSAILFLFIKKNDLTEKYGFCKADVAASKMLYYIPVIILLTANTWYGFRMNMSPLETLLYILSMLCVGFLEELIFRGLLFNAMLENGKNPAIIVSSITFGIGHIINLINGSGAELLPNLLQVVYAIAVGFMFVMIYYRTKSLLPCIITHGVFNALSAFANETGLTSKEQIVSAILITLISGAYALYIALEMKKQIRRIAMYTIYVKFECLPQRREAFIQKVKETGILDAIHTEDGCIKYDYYLSEKDPNELLLIEQWESKQHQQIHIEQPHMAQLREFKSDYISKTVLGEIELL